MSIRRVYFLCSSPRCGSTIVAEVLRKFGSFGRIDEFVSDANRPLWEREGSRYIRDCLNCDERAIAGFKVHFQEFLAIVMSSAWTMMGTPRFLHLSRDDKLGQAISFVRALQTSRFSDADRDLSIAPRYDYDAISRALHFILEQEHGWAAFFAARGLAPFQFSYERFVAEPAQVCREIGAYLNIAVEPGEIDLGSYDTRVQRDAINEQWRCRFLDETRMRMASRPFNAFLGLEKFARWHPHEMTSHDYAMEHADLAVISRSDNVPWSEFMESQEILSELGYLKGKPQPVLTRAVAEAIFHFQRDHQLLVDLRLTPGFAGLLQSMRPRRPDFSGEWVERTNKTGDPSAQVTPTANGITIVNEYRNADGDLISWRADLGFTGTGELVGTLIHAEPYRSAGHRDAILCLRVLRAGRELLGTVQPVGSPPTIIGFVKKDDATSAEKLQRLAWDSPEIHDRQDGLRAAE